MMRVSGWSRVPLPPARITPFTVRLSRCGSLMEVPRRARVDGPGCLEGGGRWRPAVSTASARAGHAVSAHGPKSRSASDAQASWASGSTHTKLPDCPKWPKVPGELRRPGPVRCLGVADLEAEAPVTGVEPAEAGQHAGQAREGDRGGTGQGRGCHQARSQELARRERGGRAAVPRAPDAGEDPGGSSVPVMSRGRTTPVRR